VGRPTGRDVLLWHKNQRLDEGVPRASDSAISRLELLESASPIAFAEHPHFSNEQSVFQLGWGLPFFVYAHRKSNFYNDLAMGIYFCISGQVGRIYAYRYPNR
jgi:hypothetical protein